ncbi:MAG: hypothetical protein ACI8RZ_007017, partial [Myxococcota bacterium]
MLWLLIGCGATWEALDGDGDGISVLEGDCDDSDPTVSVGANQLWYADADGDGLGDPDSAVMGCSAPSGYVEDGQDCDDSRLDIYPGASELCDGLDNDCDGVVDDNPADPTIYFPDGDEDGFGNGAASIASCEAPLGYVTDGTDCDDSEANVFPGSTATEIPFDGLDTDCDGRDFCTDLSCDGRPDLVLAYLYDGDSFDLSVSLFHGDGSLLDPVPAALSAEQTTDTVVADFNGDGYLDIAAANGSGLDGIVLSSVYWGSSSGHTTDNREQLLTPGAESVLAHDLDGDGLPELIFASHSRSYGPDIVYDLDSVVYWASSSGFLVREPSPLPTSGALGVAAADLDADGAQDVVFCNHRDDSLDPFTISSVIYWGGDFSKSTRLPVDGCRGLDIADLNDDGTLDIVFASYRGAASSTSTSRIYWGDGDHFASKTATDLPTVAAFSVQAADLDGDGLPELVFGSLLDDVEGFAYSESVRIYWGQATGYSTDGMTELEAAGSERPLLTDLDGDGLPEMIAPGYAAGTDFAPASFIYHGST